MKREDEIIDKIIILKEAAMAYKSE